MEANGDGVPLASATEGGNSLSGCGAQPGSSGPEPAMRTYGPVERMRSDALRTKKKIEIRCGHISAGEGRKKIQKKLENFSFLPSFTFFFNKKKFSNRTFWADSKKKLNLLVKSKMTKSLQSKWCQGKSGA